MAAVRPRFSVITPSYNSGAKLQRAIESVLIQKNVTFEHIVVDACSTDETLSLLKSNPHLKWISEPDQGQADALNKAFAMSQGEIIVSLNCDDYFAPKAFENVEPYFNSGAQFVVGNIEIESHRLGKSYLNKPKIGLGNMMRHWEENAYCYNPVGYFYTRQVQEKFPFKVGNDFTLDLEFLLAAASVFPMIKIDAMLGYYDEGPTSKTTRSQGDSAYWTEENFDYVERHISSLPLHEQEKFRRDRKWGYKRITRYWQRRQKILQMQESFRALGKKIFS